MGVVGRRLREWGNPALPSDEAAIMGDRKNNAHGWPWWTRRLHEREKPCVVVERSSDHGRSQEQCPWMAVVNLRTARCQSLASSLNEAAIRDDRKNEALVQQPGVSISHTLPHDLPMPNLWNKLAGRKPRPDPASALPDESRTAPGFPQSGSSTSELPRRHLGPATLPETPLPNMA